MISNNGLYIGKKMHSYLSLHIRHSDASNRSIVLGLQFKTKAYIHKFVCDNLLVVS